MAFSVPSAHAATTIGVQSGAGPNNGSGVLVTGDLHANDITITLAAVRPKRGGARRFTLEVADRRGRVRGGRGCRSSSRHARLCASSKDPIVYVVLGAGNDRLTVRSSGLPAPAATPPSMVPDSLAGIPTDEDGEGAFLGWRIDGGAGDDRIAGSPFFDHIIGGPGSDVLDGRRGNDLFDQGGEQGSDTIRGGSGLDALQWRATTPLRIDLSAGTFEGGTVASIEKVQGGQAGDTLIGSDSPDMLQGGGGADVIAGRGGADLLVGDGHDTFFPLVAADTIDGGAGDDVLDVDNKAFVSYAGIVVASAPGPADRLTCGDGDDRVDATPAQIVPADCEGARFLEAAATVALRPTALPDGSLVYDIPCPARTYSGFPIAVCAGTLTLTRPVTGAALGSAPFSAKGAAHAIVAVKPTAPVSTGELLGVRITGAFNGARPDDTFNQFDLGWATTR
jgi:Ca2+-binding RTX toxin-like protein